MKLSQSLNSGLRKNQNRNRDVLAGSSLLSIGEGYLNETNEKSLIDEINSIEKQISA